MMRTLTALAINKQGGEGGGRGGGGGVTILMVILWMSTVEPLNKGLFWRFCIGFGDSDSSFV